MKMRIVLVGCDDETAVEMDVTPEELRFLERLEKEVGNTSTYACMPRLDLEEVEPNES